MTDTVEVRWRALLERGEPETREVNAESPLRMLIGVSHVGRPFFAIIVSQKPGLPELTSAIEVARRYRASDGRWTLTLELQVRSLTDAFISLVSDLAAKSATAASERSALKRFLETLAEWQELLISELGRRGEVLRIAVGLHDRHPSPVLVATVGYRTVVFLHRDEKPTPALAAQAGDRVVQHLADLRERATA